MTSQSGANQWEWLHGLLNYLGYPCGFIIIYILSSSSFINPRKGYRVL